MKRVFYPTEGRLICVQRREEKTASGLLIAPEARKKDNICEVGAVHEGSGFKVGQKVYFDLAAGSIISDDGTEIYIAVDESDILATVEEMDE